jgi:hypothetical protein
MRGIFTFTSIALLVSCGNTDPQSDTASQQCSLLQVSLPSDRGIKRVLTLAADSIASKQKPLGNTRPGLQKKKVDEVEFGILVKKWYGIDFTAGAFTVDAVISARWQDKRASKLITGGAASARFATDDAETNMWLPDIAVTNIAHDGVDIISSSVLIEKNGTITKVQRALLTLKQGYQTADFPFDSQTVSIKVASTIYMRDEVKLVPTESESLWGCSSELFGNSPWNFGDTSLTTINEDDGLLRKSRGLLNITVKRQASQYVSSIFIPTMVLLAMTWFSLWLPLATPYVMPRVALSVIAILCMMSVMAKANGMIPSTGNTTWMTQYLETCVLLQFVLMLLNALILTIEHRSGGGTTVAGGFDKELIVVFPFLTAFVMMFVCMNWFLLARCLIAVAIIGYVGYVLARSRNSSLQQMQGNTDKS